ncbi:MAG: class I SAM-dependent methyltransferase [Actinobacteria bacterium]|nr:class I SAM-dependent methyltransferase [Actinomycetota bacterium]
MVPPLVERALSLAERLNFELSCSAETGRLLHVLAGQRGRSRVAEIGTGCGVGSAWILSALAPEASFVTVELDAERASAAAELLAEDRHARVLCGSWLEVLPAEAPFDLLFADGGKSKQHEELVGLLAPGGTLVMDDLTPGRKGPDPVRELWLRHGQVAAVELQVSAREAVIVGTLQPR